MRSRRLHLISALLLFNVLVIALQLWSGAYHSDFSEDDDEAAHAVSSLLVHDYIVSGFHENPVGFAKRYYVHYPKVAIGHWPPLFYAGEAGWMLIFGRTRAAMIALNGALGAALLFSVFFWVRRDYGFAAGMIAAFVLGLPPFVQSGIESAAPNIALALAAFWAAVFFGNYLEQRRSGDLLILTALILIAIGIHGRGAALLFLPAGLLLSRRIGPLALRAAIFLVILAVVLILPSGLHQSYAPAIGNILHYAAFFIYRCGVSMSWPVLLLAAIGAFTIVRRKREPRRWLAMPALLLSAWIFHSIVIAGWGDRYLITAAPAVAVLAAAGFHFLSRDFARIRFIQPALILLLCAGLAFSALPFSRKPDLGYHRLGAITPPVSLVAGDPLHEGAFVSEMALRDPRLERIVLRGSKFLASSTWIGDQYRLRVETPAKALALLDQARVEMVLMETPETQPHIIQLRQAFDSGDVRWRRTVLPGQPPGTIAFERAMPLPPGEPVIRIDLRYTLGEDLEFVPH